MDWRHESWENTSENMDNRYGMCWFYSPPPKFLDAILESISLEIEQMYLIIVSSEIFSSVNSYHHAFTMMELS